MTTATYQPTDLVRISAGSLRAALVEGAGLEPEAVDKVLGELLRNQTPDLTGERVPTTGYFVAEGSEGNPGSLVRIAKVDDHYAYLERVDGRGRYAMPIAEYDQRFVTAYRPARMSDLLGLGMFGASEGFRMPANAPDDW